MTTLKNQKGISRGMLNKDPASVRPKRVKKYKPIIAPANQKTTMKKPTNKSVEEKFLVVPKCLVKPLRKMMKHSGIKVYENKPIPTTKTKDPKISKQRVIEILEGMRQRAPQDSEIKEVVRRNNGNVSYGEVLVINLNDTVVYNQALSDAIQKIKEMRP